MRMSIEDIINAELVPEDREILEEDKERWARLGSGAHLRDWMALAPGLRIRRRLAMKINHVNEPKGRGYNETYGQLLRLAGFYQRKEAGLASILSAVLWIDDKPEHIAILREITENMTPGERSRLNSPITARQRIEKVLKARQSANPEEAEAKVKDSPVAKLKAHARELEIQLAHAHEQLAAAEAGNVVDFKKDSVEEIVNTMTDITTMSPTKAEAVARGVLERLKNRPKTTPKPPTAKAKGKGKKPTTGDDLVDALASGGIESLIDEMEK